MPSPTVLGGSSCEPLPRNEPTLSEASDRAIHHTLTRRVSAPVEIRPRPQRGPGRSRSARLPIGYRAKARQPPGDRSAICTQPLRATASGFPKELRRAATPVKGSALRPSRAEPPECRAPGCPEHPDPNHAAVSRGPVQPAGPGNPGPASLAWAVIAVPRCGDRGIGPRPPVLRPASSGSVAPRPEGRETPDSFPAGPAGPPVPAPSPMASRPRFRLIRSLIDW